MGRVSAWMISPREKQSAAGHRSSRNACSRHLMLVVESRWQTSTGQPLRHSAHPYHVLCVVIDGRVPRMLEEWSRGRESFGDRSSRNSGQAAAQQHDEAGISTEDVQRDVSVYVMSDVYCRTNPDLCWLRRGRGASRSAVQSPQNGGRKRTGRVLPKDTES